jgi:hypothetical protein
MVGNTEVWLLGCLNERLIANALIDNKSNFSRGNIAKFRLDCVPEQSVTVHTAEPSAEVENTCKTGYLSKLQHCHP